MFTPLAIPSDIHDVTSPESGRPRLGGHHGFGARMAALPSKGGTDLWRAVDQDGDVIDILVQALPLKSAKRTVWPLAARNSMLGSLFSSADNVMVIVSASRTATLVIARICPSTPSRRFAKHFTRLPSRAAREGSTAEPGEPKRSSPPCVHRASPTNKAL
jgi:hypothetical protein